MSYHYIDHTADVLFQAEGTTLAELFEQCALAVQETQVHLADVEAKQQIEITGKNKNIEYLLFDFLDDLLLHKDKDQLLLVKFSITIEDREDGYHLHCVASGDTLNPNIHEQGVDVKAITMHEFFVKQENGKWKAQVLVDI